MWTAEMILLFCLERPNVFSFDDLAIQRGLRMIYHHRKIGLRRFSPYCGVASLYFGAIAGGAVPGMKDYAPKGKRSMAGRGHDFAECKITVVTPLRCYIMDMRDEAPADANQYFNL